VQNAEVIVVGMKKIENKNALVQVMPLGAPWVTTEQWWQVDLEKAAKKGDLEALGLMARNAPDRLNEINNERILSYPGLSRARSEQVRQLLRDAAVVQQRSMSPAADSVQEMADNGEWSCHENKNCFNDGGWSAKNKFNGPNIRTLLLCSSI
jgi:hypothetical protein